MNSNRIVAFDYLKLFAIFLVIWGHCLQYFITEPDRYDNELYCIIYSFHMPLFMMISGFFAMHSFSLSITELMKKKAIQLLIPSLTYGIIITILEQAWGSWLSVMFGQLWFLKTLFICYIFGWIVFNSRHKTTALILTLFMSQLSTIYYIHILYPAFVVGIILKKQRIAERPDFNMKLYLIFIAIAFIMLLLNMNINIFNAPSLSKAIVSHSYDTIRYTLYLRGFRILVGICGSLVFFYVFVIVNPKLKASFLSKWGGVTLGIYGLQTVLLEVYLKRWICLNDYSLLVSDYIITPFISFVVLFICVLLIKLIQRSKLLSLLLLGSRHQ